MVDLMSQRPGVAAAISDLLERVPKGAQKGLGTDGGTRLNEGLAFPGPADLPMVVSERLERADEGARISRRPEGGVDAIGRAVLSVQGEGADDARRQTRGVLLIRGVFIEKHDVQIRVIRQFEAAEFSHGHDGKGALEAAA